MAIAALVSTLSARATLHSAALQSAALAATLQSAVDAPFGTAPVAAARDPSLRPALGPAAPPALAGVTAGPTKLWLPAVLRVPLALCR